jgi:hypothetical protein
MKCLVKFSCSLAGSPSLSSFSLFHVEEAGSSLWPPFLGVKAVVGAVTPGLKAFPSCLIDKNALARPVLPGRAGTASVVASFAIEISSVTLVVLRPRHFRGESAARIAVGVLESEQDQRAHRVGVVAGPAGSDRQRSVL